MEGKVKGPLCVVRDKCHLHHALTRSTFTFACICSELQLAPTSASMNTEVQRGFQLPYNKLGPNFLLGTVLKRGSLPIREHASHLRPCIPADPAPQLLTAGLVPHWHKQTQP